MLIFWMDDDPESVTRNGWGDIFSDGVNGLTASIEVVSVRGLGLSDVEDLFDEKKGKHGVPDLILMDHNLTAARFGFQASGASLSQIIRAQHPTIAVACVTAEATERESLDYEAMSEYVALFTKDAVGGKVEDILVLARDYRRLCDEHGKPHSAEEIIRLLAPPDEDSKHLEFVLPAEFGSDPDCPPSVTPHLVARWIYGGLLARPGFLVDECELTTMLGLKFDAIEKCSSHVQGAKYSGIFARNSHPKWWRSQIANLAFEATTNPEAQTLAEAGRALPGVEEQDFSVGYHDETSVPAPDCVAFTDRTQTKRVQTFRRFTEEFLGGRSSLSGFSPYLVLSRT